MKMSAAAGLLAVLCVTSAQAQPDSGKSAPVCIRPFDSATGSIDHTHVVDRQTILFYMRDGKVWKNTLRTPCMGLLYHGFNFATHQDEVCGNAQMIQVIGTGEVCQLGAFVPYTPPT